VKGWLQMRNLILLSLFLFAIAGCEGPKAAVSADDLAAAYRDVSKADSLYKGKIIAVRGTVTFAGGMLGLPYGWQAVCLGGQGSDAKTAVICHFPPESAEQTERLQVGQQVVIRGVCKGDSWELGTPFLTNCVIAN
jgi:hypothetical protein